MNPYFSFAGRWGKRKPWWKCFSAVIGLNHNNAAALIHDSPVSPQGFRKDNNSCDVQEVETQFHSSFWEKRSSGNEWDRQEPIRRRRTELHNKPHSQLNTTMLCTNNAREFFLKNGSRKNPFLRHFQTGIISLKRNLQSAKRMFSSGSKFDQVQETHKAWTLLTYAVLYFL